MTRRTKLTRLAGSTDEQVISARPCFLYGIRPELTTTGTITVRDAAAIGGSNIVHVCAIGLPQAGKDFDGALMVNGLTVKLTVGTDLAAIIWEPAP